MKINTWKSFIVVPMLLISFIALSQEDEEEIAPLPFPTKDSVIKELNQALSEIKDQNLEEKLSDINIKGQEYISFREKECKGEFSSLEFDEKGQSKINKRKLTKEEKSVCLLELIYFRKEFTEKIFDIRLQYLKKLQAKQIENLEKIKQESIKELDTLAKKYNR